LRVTLEIAEVNVGLRIVVDCLSGEEIDVEVGILIVEVAKFALQGCAD